MEIYGKKLNVKQLRQRIGNPDQVAAIRSVTLDDGNERGVRAAQFHTGSGLDFTVLLDRGMDLSAASFQGRAMGWRSTTGDVAPAHFEPEGIRWLRSYFGGLVTTCGLSNVGAPAPNSALTGEGLHGRISHTPARDVQVRQEWRKNAYVLEVSGTMRETSVFGQNLTLKRTVATTLGAKQFTIHDVVTNEGFKTAPFMILYHCNIGWPAVDQGARLLAPTRKIAPRDREAAAGAKDYAKCGAPMHGFKEKVYYHDMAAARDGSVTAAVVNDGFGKDNGFGVYLKYRLAELPRFAQWKQLGEQEYVVGLDPSHSGVEGREIDESLGLLQHLAPGEQREFHLEFGAITTAAELAAIEKQVGKSRPVHVEHYSAFVHKA